MSQVATFTAVAKDVKVWIPVQEKGTEANNGIAVISGPEDVLPDGYVVSLYGWDGD